MVVWDLIVSPTSTFWPEFTGRVRERVGQRAFGARAGGGAVFLRRPSTLSSLLQDPTMDIGC